MEALDSVNVMAATVTRERALLLSIFELPLFEGGEHHIEFSGNFTAELTGGIESKKIHQANLRERSPTSYGFPVKCDPQALPAEAC